ncbi:hypothetical protein HMSSN036_39350 [Paenibacillus macerans]|nr:hypothetical protein HMSSN036_39350 [Paenibacillus macerans]
MTENWHQTLKNKNREELIAAGKELFMKQSFLNVNIKDVCGRAGVSRVTFYKHFQSMDELIFEVQMELLESMTEFVQRTAAGALNGKEQLRSMLDAWIDLPGSIPDISSLSCCLTCITKLMNQTRSLRNVMNALLMRGRNSIFWAKLLKPEKKTAP